MPPKSPPSTGATTCPTQPVSGAPCTCFMVRSLSRKISQLYDDTLAPSGLKGTQFSLLAQARVRRGQEPLSVSALAQRLNTDRTTMTRNLRTLEQAGLIALVPGKDADRLDLFFESSDKAVFHYGDNLTIAPDGQLIVCEDQYTENVANTAKALLG